MSKYVFLAAFILFSFSNSAQASDPVSALTGLATKNMPSCKTRGNSTITVTVNDFYPSAKEALGAYDKITSDIKNALTDQGIENPHISNLRYSVNEKKQYSRNNKGASEFNLNASQTINFKETDKAQDIYLFLVDKGFQARLNVNVNSYGNCR